MAQAAEVARAAADPDRAVTLEPAGLKPHNIQLCEANNVHFWLRVLKNSEPTDFMQLSFL